MDKEEGNSQAEHYHGFEITKKGIELRQKAIAGGVKVEFTRGAIGIGRPVQEEDIYLMEKLISPALDVPIKENYAENINHVMTIVIDNKDLKEDILMTEIGIFARLLNQNNEVLENEVLYGYTYTEKYDYIPVPTDYFIYREISFNTILSKDGNFEIVFDGSKIYVTQEELKNAIEIINKELAAKADKTELAAKADKTELAAKADKTEAVFIDKKKIYDNIDFEDLNNAKEGVYRINSEFKNTPEGKITNGLLQYYSLAGGLKVQIIHEFNTNKSWHRTGGGSPLIWYNWILSATNKEVKDLENRCLTYKPQQLPEVLPDLNDAPKGIYRIHGVYKNSPVKEASLDGVIQVLITSGIVIQRFIQYTNSTEYTRVKGTTWLAWRKAVPGTEILSISESATKDNKIDLNSKYEGRMQINSIVLNGPHEEKIIGTVETEQIESVYIQTIKQYPNKMFQRGGKDLGAIEKKQSKNDQEKNNLINKLPNKDIEKEVRNIEWSNWIEFSNK